MIWDIETMYKGSKTITAFSAESNYRLSFCCSYLTSNCEFQVYYCISFLNCFHFRVLAVNLQVLVGHFKNLQVIVSHFKWKSHSPSGEDQGSGVQGSLFPTSTGPLMPFPTPFSPLPYSATYLHPHGASPSIATKRLSLPITTPLTWSQLIAWVSGGLLPRLWLWLRILGFSFFRGVFGNE